ncbi:MAG: J domain-containing protein [Actinomycetota bacterium]|nr:J domain-containing protein [Actinomycetota bacterium]
MSDQEGLVQDLYEILGVSRDASEDDIKRAYRQRARNLHPDTGGDTEQFKQLTAAYEVLKDPRTRANYDRFGDPRGPGGAGGDPFGGFGDLGDLIDTLFGGFGGSRTATGPRARTGRRAGRDAVVDVSLTLEEAASGTERDVEVSVRRTCQRCEGSGAQPGSGMVRCERCGGAGAVQQVTRSVFGQMLTTTTCAACGGNGQRLAQPCGDCRGEGRLESTETVTVPVPPGVDDGTQLRLTGQGEAGTRRGSPGDLYVRLRVQPHPVFTRDGDDLHCELRLPMTQAALGGDVTVSTLHGEQRLRVPPGAQTGDVLTLKRQGMPRLNGGGARGHLHVHCRVETPTRLGPKEEALLRQLAELRGEEPRRSGDGQGLLGRLRGAFGG